MMHCRTGTVKSTVFWAVPGQLRNMTQTPGRLRPSCCAMRHVAARPGHELQLFELFLDKA
jgi:hypothetical protein